MKGSNWHSSNGGDLNVSDRQTMTQNFNNVRDHRCGGRGVRSW
jgi:hypothetical protein